MLSLSLNRSSHIPNAVGWQRKGEHSLSTFIFNSLLSIKYDLYDYKGNHNKIENHMYERMTNTKQNFI